jgi:hypothetical protein
MRIADAACTTNATFRMNQIRGDYQYINWMRFEVYGRRLSVCLRYQGLTAALKSSGHSRQEYVEYLRSMDTEESELGPLWLRLWRAERRRDELFRSLD